MKPFFNKYQALLIEPAYLLKKNKNNLFLKESADTGDYTALSSEESDGYRRTGKEREDNHELVVFKNNFVRKG